ncbi:MAG TPA: TIGR03936 family radical SAM-associated protein [Holophagaceae bacterium]|nr:TIGR03936 family radical SAM-associated protein [Holophagaceae bacterium]
MNPHAPPPEAIAREAYLKRCLEAAAAAAPSKADSALQALQDPSRDIAALVAELEGKELLEEALSLLREPSPIRAALAPAAAKAKLRRTARWALDAGRVRVRLTYSKGGEAAQLGAPELQTLFVAVLRLEGLPPCLDLGKRPRPSLAAAPPLPPGVAGGAEWVELELARSPAGDAEARIEGLNRRLPPSLRIIAWEEAPNFATPIAELCAQAHWSWPCPAAMRRDAAARVAAFLGASTFGLEKVGKVEGQKLEKQLDLRAVVVDMAWQGDHLRFTTRLGEFAALNPLKLLGAVLGCAPESIQGLRRLGFELLPDPRLAKADKYQTKLKNIYEDAVLLGSASNITIVDEDDDEPIKLG